MVSGTSTLSAVKESNLHNPAFALASRGVKPPLYPKENEVEPHMIFLATMLKALVAPVTKTATACEEVKERQKIFYESESEKAISQPVSSCKTNEKIVAARN